MAILGHFCVSGLLRGGLCPTQVLGGGRCPTQGVFMSENKGDSQEGGSVLPGGVPMTVKSSGNSYGSF